MVPAGDREPLLVKAGGTAGEGWGELRREVMELLMRAGGGVDVGVGGRPGGFCAYGESKIITQSKSNRQIQLRG